MPRSTSTDADYYAILNLPFTSSSGPILSKQQIKLAYHKALLAHHPDKASTVALAHESALGGSTPYQTPGRGQGQGQRKAQQPIYTIDEITTAYKTLSDPFLRADYDRALRLDRAKVAEREKTGDVFHTGLEIVDLEDLACDEDGTGATMCWYRGCRCGDKRGFLVTEADLEREAEHGEIVLGCRGCSLWLKVLFAVEDG